MFFSRSDNESKGSVLDDKLKALLENADELLRTGTGESRREAYSKLTAYLSKVNVICEQCLSPIFEPSILIDIIPVQFLSL